MLAFELQAEASQHACHVACLGSSALWHALMIDHFDIDPPTEMIWNGNPAGATGKIAQQTQLTWEHCLQVPVAAGHANDAMATGTAHF